MALQEGPGSTLSDVVGASPIILDLWNDHKLTPERAAGQPLHASLVAFWSLYWGRNIEQDKDEWRERNRNTKKNRNSRSGSYSTTQIPKSVDGDSEVDADGSFVLTFPFPFLDLGLEKQKILVRKDYVRIYDAFEDWEVSSVEDIAPSVVVTGQPGIGKSLWVFYALRRRIGEGKPILWHVPTESSRRRHHPAMRSTFLFVAEGVFRVPAEFCCVDFRRRVWALVDADVGAGARAAGADGDELERDGDGDGPSADSGLPVPVDLVLHGSNLEVIYVSSPQRARWKRLEKTTRPAVCLMEVWSREEMRQLIDIDDTLDPTLTENIYNQFGPIPRLWYDLQSPPAKTLHSSSLSSCLSALTPSLSYLTPSSISSLIYSTLFLSHSPPPFLLLTRKDPTQPVSTPALAPPSPHVAGLLVDHMRRKWSREEVMKLYRWFVGCPGLEGLVGVVFGAFCRHVLEEGIVLDVVPMGQSENRQVSGEIGHSREAAVEGAVRLEVKPTKVVEFDASSPPSSIEEDVYYSLSKLYTLTVNQPTTDINTNTNPDININVDIDSFIIHDGHLHLFHFTTEQSRPAIRVNPGFMDFLRACEGVPPLPEESWRLVLIVPAGGSREGGSGRVGWKCPTLPPLLEGLAVFRGVIRVE